jgi:hypothetical protein
MLNTTLGNYQPHPSKRLQALFKAKPYQGAHPERARFVFVGLDANYQAEIESDVEIFKSVEAYHADGVKFWRTAERHHPFMLDDYRGDGKYYHRNFSKIGFKSQHAEWVSFVEVLDVPTVGRSNLRRTDLNRSHIDWLASLIHFGRRRHVFLSRSVTELLADHQAFKEITRNARVARPSEVLPAIYEVGKTKVYKHQHFAAWGTRLQKNIAAIARLRECEEGISDEQG